MKDLSFIVRRSTAALLALACASLATSAASSPTPQNDWNQSPPTTTMAMPALIGVAATRTSPFDPPEEDVFVTDDGVGLDTGCTYEYSSAHPLIVDVAIDRAVGPVDANGYLVEADALIAAGVIPSTVNVILPAWDIDMFGGPPAEQDDLYLNGDYLGTLTGDNNVWKLNTFSVDVRNLKFPAPVSGGTVTPAQNRFTIYIDTASGSYGNWCMSVDWVAIELPIDDVEFGLVMNPTATNPIMVDDEGSTDLIDTIWSESTGTADCSFSLDAGMDIETVPFSGPAESSIPFQPGEAKVRVSLTPCTMVGGAPTTPTDPPLPEVQVDWSITDTTLASTETWTGLTGDVTLQMPSSVGAYDAVFEITTDGQPFRTVTRRLYVTKRAPAGVSASTPRRKHYEKAVTWADGKSAEADILTDLLAGIYGYGQSQWRYGYVNSSGCSWQGLLSKPLGAGSPTCDYSDCYVFSDVLDALAGILGIANLEKKMETGTTGSFVTVATASLDDDFKGQVEPLPMADNNYDRYSFGSHSLRKPLGQSTYYDATFNGVYSAQDEFIDWNQKVGVRNTLWGPMPYLVTGSDSTGNYYETEEGVELYRQYTTLPGFYAEWGETLAYNPVAAGASAGASVFAVAGITPAASEDTQLTGNVTFETVDDDGDGRNEALVANLEIEVVTAGFYELTAALMKNGAVVADRPLAESPLPSGDSIGPTPGIYTARLQFSGEQIFASGEDGPYDLVILIQGDDLDDKAVTTPAISHTLFGEYAGQIVGVTETPVDTDADGRYDYLELAAEVEIVEAGDFILQGALAANGGTVSNASDSQTLTVGTHSLRVQFGGVQIFRSGEDGPYDTLLTLVHATDGTQDQLTAQTQSYAYFDFEGRIDPTGTMSDTGVDSNSNGLYEFLRIEVEAEIRDPASYLVSVALRDSSETKVVFSEQLMTLPLGVQTLTLNVEGPEILSQEMDGPYWVDISLRDPSTNEVLDAVRLPQQTAAYDHGTFEPLGGAAAIRLTGVSGDRGLDTNGNGLFDQLEVDVAVEVTGAGSYTWSARLEDIDGTEIGFNSRSGSLAVGTGTITLVFGGDQIGANGAAGPYYLRGLLVSGPNGANLIAEDVGQTSDYAAEAFEGFVAPTVGDLDSDGDVDRDDLMVMLGHRNQPASGPSDPMDLDGDGMITAVDLRQLRLLCTRSYCATQ